MAGEGIRLPIAVAHLPQCSSDVRASAPRRQVQVISAPYGASFDHGLAPGPVGVLQGRPVIRLCCRSHLTSTSVHLVVHFISSVTNNDTLTRPAPADESAPAAHPLPVGERRRTKDEPGKNQGKTDLCCGRGETAKRWMRGR